MEQFIAIRDDISELKVIVAKQEMTLVAMDKTLELIKEDLKAHMKRSEANEALYNLVRAEQAKLREEHKLTKQLLLSKIEKEQMVAAAKSHNLWLVLKTVFYTLSSVGAILLALKELEILDKLF